MSRPGRILLACLCSASPVRAGAVVAEARAIAPQAAAIDAPVAAHATVLATVLAAPAVETAPAALAYAPIPLEQWRSVAPPSAAARALARLRGAATLWSGKAPESVRSSVPAWRMVRSGLVAPRPAKGELTLRHGTNYAGQQWHAAGAHNPFDRGSRELVVAGYSLPAGLSAVASEHPLLDPVGYAAQPRGQAVGESFPFLIDVTAAADAARGWWSAVMGHYVIPPGARLLRVGRSSGPGGMPVFHYRYMP